MATARRAITASAVGFRRPLPGPVIFLVLAGVIVMFDPVLILGEADWNRSRPTAAAAAATENAALCAGTEPHDIFRAQEGSWTAGR